MSGMEIERKFLVRSDDYKRCAYKSYRIKQGYISSANGVTVRVRVRNHQGFLTIKGPSLDGGLSRYEFEKEITLDEANSLFSLCEPGIIDKTRYLVDYEGFTFEVDEFYGDNEGLTVAEVELKSVEEKPMMPPFIDREVTGDRRYYNSHLRRNPYCNWKENV